jgi:hypothetical protein
MPPPHLKGQSVTHVPGIPCYLSLRKNTFGSDFPQIAAGRRGYAGSNTSISAERDSIRKEQLLEPLSLVEGSLHPEVGGARRKVGDEVET